MKHRLPITTWVFTFNRGDGTFDLAIVHEWSRDRAETVARGMIETATLPIENVYQYGAENVGALFGLTYTGESLAKKGDVF